MDQQVYTVASSAMSLTEEHSHHKKNNCIIGNKCINFKIAQTDHDAAVVPSR